MIRQLAANVIPIALGLLVGVTILTQPAAIDFRPCTALNVIAVLIALITYGITNAIAEHLTQTTDQPE